MAVVKLGIAVESPEEVMDKLHQQATCLGPVNGRNTARDRGTRAESLGFERIVGAELIFVPVDSSSHSIAGADVHLGKGGL